MKMISRLFLILLLGIIGSSVWASSGDDDSAKNLISEEVRSDDIEPLIDRRSDLDDVDFSSFFDMDTDDDDANDNKQDSDGKGNTENKSSSSTEKSKGSETIKKNSTPSTQNQVVVGPYQVSVVDSRSPLLSSLGLGGKHLQHLTSSAYSPYSRRRSSYSSRSYAPYPYHPSESIRSSSYAEYPPQQPPSYGHSRPPPPPPNAYPQDQNREYVPMGGHYKGNDREFPQEPPHPSQYAQEKAYPPNSVDQPPQYGAYKPKYAPPNPPPNPPPSGPVPHDQYPSDSYRGGHYSNPSTDPKYQTAKRGPYNYHEPVQHPSGTDGYATKESSEPNYDRSAWRQSSQHPLHPAPLPHRAPSHSDQSAYSPQPKPYPPRSYEKTTYSSPSSYSRPSEASHSYSKSQYGGPPPATEKRPYSSHPAPHHHHHYPSYHPSAGSPKSKTPQRAGTVTYGSEGSYQSHHHSALPSKPMITLKFKTRAPEAGHGHGLSIPLNFNPLEVVKKLATPLSVFNPLANKKVTIGITIEQKDKHTGSSEILHSY